MPLNIAKVIENSLYSLAGEARIAASEAKTASDETSRQPLALEESQSS